MKTWNQWRTWDLADVEKSLAMHYLYNHSLNAIDPGLGTNKKMQLGIRSRNIRCVIDPGERQSEVEISMLVVNLLNMPPTAPSGLMLVGPEKPAQKLVVQAHLKGIYVDLQWEILSLLEGILGIVKDLENPDAQREPLTRSAAEDDSIPWQTVQVVLGIDSSVLRLTTLNLEAQFANNELKLSAVRTARSATNEIDSVNVLVHAHEAWSEFRSNSQVLITAKAVSPNIYLSREAQSPNFSPEDEWKLAATSSALNIDIKEELLDMVELADRLICEELLHLKLRFGGMLQSQQKNTMSKVQLQSGLPKLNVSMLMESYEFNVALLQSIVYSVNGGEGRVSITPELGQHNSLDLNWDISTHSHVLLSTAHAEPHVISLLKLPPINGHLGVRRTATRTSLNVTTSVEEIVVDASAVHGLLTTFKLPEVSKTFRAMQADLETIQHHLDQAFPPSTTVTLSEDLPKPELVYNLGVTLAGIVVKADAPGKLPNAGVASLSIGLNCVQLKAFNVRDAGSEILPLPEIRAQLRRIFVEMNIHDSFGTRPCGNLNLSATIHCTLRNSGRGIAKRNYKVETKGIEINVFAETASAVVDVLNYLQDRIKDLDLSRERRYLQRLRQPTRKPSIFMGESMHSEMSVTSSGIFTSTFSISLLGIQVSWIVGQSVPVYPGHEPHDLVLSIKMIDLRTQSQSSSRLVIEDLQLQMVPISQDKSRRALNSALLPQMVFNVGYASSDQERKMSFQAAGKALDLQLESQFILPANVLQRSINLAVDKFRRVSASWQLVPTSSGVERKNPFGDKQLSSLLVDADFAGAVVTLRGRNRNGRSTDHMSQEGAREPQQGRFGQFVGDGDAAAATLRAPGIALKVEYSDNGNDSSFNAEFKVNASSNTLSPTVVPLILDISNSVKTIVGDTEKDLATTENKPAQTFLSDERILTADPSTLLGKTSLNLGIRICRQEFSLSCQPIARVDAAARFEDIYITANSVKSPDHDHFFAVSASFEKLYASVQHVYSRESTFSFNAEKIVLSLMNSKHLSGTAGISAILKIYPMKTHINARQLQDFLLFREIWIPMEIRQPSARPTTTEPQEYLVQRYQQVANATAFPWTATVSIEKVEVDLDLGQAIGKASLLITNMWASSKKASDWEQTLCIGIEKVGIDGSGRMSGFLELAEFQVQTTISWPTEEGTLKQTPLIQASVGFDRLRVKAAFDYQAFLIADITSFAFLMYNVRERKDRLVAILDGDTAHVCVTATSAAQSLALIQAIEKLVQENQSAYGQSLKDIEKYLKRQSITVRPRSESKATPTVPTKPWNDDAINSPISLHTDVVVTLRSINLGAFPSSFSDNTVFLLEASDVQARFAVAMNTDNRIQSALGMTLGQLSVALTSTAHPSGPRTLQEITVEDVIETMASARGGTILRVPKVIATMQTWQAPRSYQIDYIFKSSFEGKVDVGWNYTRISFLRDMWETHSQTLAQRLGKPLPESAVKIRTTSENESPRKNQADAAGGAGSEEQEREKTERITAVVNVPQSKYEYHALETPIIETPQLRDMGEATPPLEWIGLHRDRLPNVTHQIVIVGLLGVAREVEEAYERILGST
jgi:hypothetical protein